MKILAVDPGSEQSAFVYYDDALVRFGMLPNRDVLEKLHAASEGFDDLGQANHLAIEMIASYGMAVGKEVFETCVWIGRMIEAWNGPHTLVYRRDVKMHLCNNNAAKDANIRAALIDRWGGKDKAIGKKASPGPLYGVSADVWSALAVAVTFADGAVKARAA